MSLPPGTSIGRYEIIAPLGVGGMGEVYRARDARIGRDVALKVLPELFASDPERIVRFEREAQVLGSLNHQNIAAIYGIEQSAAAEAAPPVLVMELVEGSTLAERIDSGPIPIEEALSIAAQIAEALEAAHELGIIHRDLKPANIKLRPDGTVKVLDFGLAKIAEPAGASWASASAATFSPTLSLAASRAGMIVGTAAYMAPEQARARIVDKRADVWAFGVVLYEMLTGQRAFPGEDVSDTLATVIKFDPDWSKLPAETPASIRRLLKRCLVKDPRLRLRDCGSALLDIRDAQTGEPSYASNAAHISATQPRRSWLPLVAVCALAAVAGAGGWALLSRPAPVTAPPTRRFTITLPESDRMPPGVGHVVAIAPNGRVLVYRAQRGGTTHLFRRTIDQFDATPIPGAEGGANPAFSPDGEWLFFETTGPPRLLKRMPSTGGPSQTIATVAGGGTRGFAWNTRDRLVFGVNAPGVGLIQVAASGGPTTELFKPDPHRWAIYPDMLPDGKGVLFTLTDLPADPGEIHALLFDTSETKKVLADAMHARVLPTGHLVFMRSGSLWAVPFDTGRLEATGTAVPLIEGVRMESGGAIQYDLSDDGTLVYVPGASSAEQRTLQFVAPDGRIEPLPAAARTYVSTKLSPDGSRIAVQVDTGDAADVWVVEIARGTATRLTSENGFDGSPIWTQDGKGVVFASARNGRWLLNRKAADGTGSIEELATLRSNLGVVFPTAITPDDSVMLMVDTDIGIVPADGKGVWKPLIATSVAESQGVLSPDGRWLAYTSTETGSVEVYVQPFPGPGHRQMVSVGGGHMPTWSANGRRLFYLQGPPPREVMSAQVEPTPEGGIRISAPTKVVDWRFFTQPRTPRYYDLAADGRLLVIARGADAGPAGMRDINVVINWFEELKRLVPIQVSARVQARLKQPFQRPR